MNGTLRIGLATSAQHPNLAPDDLILAECLSHYATVVPVVWTGGAPPALDACLLRSTWDSHLDPQRFDRWLMEVAESTRLFNSLRLLRWNTHKGYLRELASCGVPTIETRIYRQGTFPDLQRDMVQLHWNRIVVKPAISASAYKTAAFDMNGYGANDAQRLLFEILQERDALVQPLHDEVFTTGERSAVFINGNFSHVVRRLPFGTITPNRRNGDPAVRFSTAESEFADTALAAVPETPLYARVDYILQKSGEPLLMELEMIDPSLFFQHHPPAAEQFAVALRNRLFTSLTALR
jgi:hypothetical protein